MRCVDALRCVVLRVVASATRRRVDALRCVDALHCESLCCDVSRCVALQVQREDLRRCVLCFDLCDGKVY